MVPNKNLPEVLIITTLGRIKLPNSPEQHFFEKLFFPSRMRENYGAKKWPKLNLRGHWSQILINSTIFATIKFLISVF